MFPTDIRQAIAQHTPVVFTLGVLEYHSEHLSTGVDTLVITRCLDILEQEIPLVIMPPFYYGAASYAVEPPEGKGSIHVDSQVLVPFASSILTNLLRIGFRNIYIIVHHQSENFAAGMPTDLSFKLAARQATFDFLEKERGEGWWGRNSSSDYYEGHHAGDNPFNWIKVCPLLSQSLQCDYPIDHAGKLETAMMMSLCPEGVDMDRFTTDNWYAQTAKDASASFGEEIKAKILDYLRLLLK